MWHAYWKTVEDEGIEMSEQPKESGLAVKDNFILGDCPNCQSHLRIPIPTQLLPKRVNAPQSLPLQGRTRIAWFMIGGACWLIMALWLLATGGLNSAILILTLPGIFIPIFMGQYKAKTFDVARRRIWEWVGKLSWAALISVMVLQFSVPLLFLALGLSIIGVPFFLLGVGTWIKRRVLQKPAQILEVKQ